LEFNYKNNRSRHLKYISKVTELDYDEAVPHYLQSSEWVNLKEHATGYKKVEILIGEEFSLRGNIVKRRNPLKRLDKEIAVYFGPNFATKNIMSDTVLFKSALLNLAKIGIKKITFLNFENWQVYPTGELLKSILEISGFHFTEKRSQTSVIDLNSLNNLEVKNFHSSVYKNLRKAESVLLFKVKDIDDYKEFLFAHSTIKGLPLPNKNFIDAYYQNSKHTQLFIAKSGVTNRIIGTLGFFHDEIMATEVMSSIDRTATEKGVQERLHVELFQRALELGLSYFDLSGLNIDGSGEWDSISKFKLKFGGVQKTLLETKVQNYS
jgi:hypothetical protein